MEQKLFFYIGEEEDKFEEGSGSSDEDTMEEDCYECKVSGSSDEDTIEEDCYECKVSGSSDKDTMEEDCMNVR